MKRRALLLVLVLALTGCGPSAEDRAREARFQQALVACDQLPDLGDRVDCWGDAYARRRAEGG